ncbi:MAG: RHS repeat-associated core domain-containing protein [Nitrospira sp.]|nr:RHS repeat-associated core domain-containing protein [Nitrospira sp.]
MIKYGSSTISYNTNNQQTAFGTATETYDLNGNLATFTDASGTTTYTWNDRNQLTSISGPGLTASFTYDSFGKRTGKTINGTTINFLYDGLNPVQEKNGATVTANLLTGLGIDEFLTRTDSVGVRSLLPDALGSTVALGDGIGTLQTQYTYEPFGFTTQTGVGSTSSFKFTGREDDGTGLFYYRARYYQPRLQRFISEDPIGFASGDFNLYAFLGNNPVNDIDPLGHTKGGKKGLSVTHNGQILNKQSSLSDINAAIADAQAKGMSQKHIKALKALRKVVSRGGTLGICGNLLIDQILLEIEGLDVWLEYCKNDPNCL